MNPFVMEVMDDAMSDVLRQKTEVERLRIAGRMWQSARAHLHGGIPVSEITLLTSYFDNYAGLRSLLFQSSRHFLSAVTEASNKLPADGTRSVPATPAVSRKATAL